MSGNIPPASEPENGNWLTTIIEGGLPQFLAGPAGKAISRLIGAGVEIPAAYLERISQGVRDKTQARSVLTQAIADQAKQQVVDDPAIMERAMNSMLMRSYRAQENKESVARVAIEDLSEDEPDPHNAGPSEDWMNKFERYAEEAGSVDLQLLFGKILAGEVRKPGSISPSTLHLVSMLEGHTASLIDKILPFTLPSGITLLDAMSPALSIAEISFIEQSGFFSADKTYNPKLDDSGKNGEELGNNNFLILQGNQNSKVRMGKAGILSFAGQGLVQALQPKFNVEAYCDLALKCPDVKIVVHGTGAKTTGGRFEILEPTVVENPDYKEA